MPLAHLKFLDETTEGQASSRPLVLELAKRREETGLGHIEFDKAMRHGMLAAQDGFGRAERAGRLSLRQGDALDLGVDAKPDLQLKLLPGAPGHAREQARTLAAGP